MRAWRHLVAGVRALLTRSRDDRDIEDEVGQFFDAAVEELIAGGATPGEARRAVRIRYGDRLTAREDVRASGWERIVDDLLSDLRIAARRLRRSPAFTIPVVLVLGLGLGAATAIFSVVKPVLLEPLSYPDAHRVVALAPVSDDGTTSPTAYGIHLELAARARVFDALSVYKSWTPAFRGRGEPERWDGQQVSAAYFEVLGVSPVLGSGFDPAMDRPGGERVVILSEAVWRRSFGADPAVVGGSVRLDGEPYTVVGVMPADFENAVAPGAEIWSLLQYEPLVTGFDTREWGLHLGSVARLRPGVGVDDAERALSEIGDRPTPDFPRPTWASLGGGFTLRPLARAATADVRPTTFVLSGAVLLLLAIACLNLTVLLLARGARRDGELAMRAALGAGRGRLARQLVTETLLLAGAGGLLGLGVAQVGLDAFAMVGPPALVGLSDLRLDLSAFLFASAVTSLVGLVVGLAPATIRSWSDSPLLRSAGGTSRRSSSRSRRGIAALIVAEVALALVLLVGAGLLLRTTRGLFDVPSGFDAENVLVMRVHATGLEGGDAAIHRFFDAALEAVSEVPGVRHAALTSQLPLGGEGEMFGARVEPGAQGPSADDEVGNVYRYAVTQGYSDAMGIELVRGSALDPTRPDAVPRPAMVSEALASRLLPSGDPIGRAVRFGPYGLEPYTVVGVVRDVKQISLDASAQGGMYVLADQWHWSDRVRWLVVRSERPLASLVSDIRAAVWSVDPDPPIVRAQAMSDLVQRSEQRRRFVLLVLSAFATIAIALVAMGLYGILSGSVAERMRELGIRAALGASDESLVAMVVRQGLVLTAAGVTIGLVGAALATRILSSLLFGVSSLDPLTYLAGVSLLVGVAVAACVVPAIRASRADPLTALRAE